ncbi:MAG: hypothetical protein IPL84_18545 [Chitinophagaceae bacterium]|nr:hypothetical protein [Chitinophagaceae bacterium]
MPKIVQFLHPAEEATPLNKGDRFIPWNNHPTHRRKFLISDGNYVNRQGDLEKKQLAFWGEWEAQSEIIPINKANNNPPNYINIPYVNPSVPNRTHTTDPFVFGHSFRYIICMQRAFHNILTELESNSIILFGSSINQTFCLDTVFVVSDNQTNYNLNTISNLVPSEKRGQYYYATIYPIYGDTNCNPLVDDLESCRITIENKCTFYEGVTYHEKDTYNQMYSFAPCKIYNEDSPLGSLFSQPKIYLDFISGSQTRGIHSKDCSIKDIQMYWNSVSEQIEKQSLLKGVYFKNPELKNNNCA